MSIYTGVSITTLRTWLTESQLAYHALVTGQQTVSLSMGDQRLAFTAADADKLATHIRSLQTAISIREGSTTAAQAYRPAVATWNRLA